MRLLAHTCFAQSRFDDSIGLLRHAIELCAELDPDAGMLPLLLLNLAGSYAAVGSLEKAKELYAKPKFRSAMRGGH
jgi:hypothetical protein